MAVSPGGMPFGSPFSGRNRSETSRSEIEARYEEYQQALRQRLLGDPDAAEKERASLAALNDLAKDMPFESLSALISFMQMMGSSEKYLKDMAGSIMERVAIARVARMLELPDHAVFFLQKAYGDISKVLDDIMGLFRWEDMENGLQIPPQLREGIEFLKALKDLVMTEMRLTFGSMGVHLSRPEVEAMMSEDKHFDERMPKAQQQLLQDFHNGMTAEQRRELVASGGNKLLEALPELIGRAADTLLSLTEDSQSTTGQALIGVNAALTRLEGAKAIMRMLGNGKNSLLAEFSKEAKKFEPQVFELEKTANTVFRAIENRTVARIRSPIDERKSKLEEFLRPGNPENIRLFKEKEQQGLDQSLNQNPVRLLRQSILHFGGTGGARGGSSRRGRA